MYFNDDKLKHRSKLTVLGKFHQNLCTNNSDILVIILEQKTELRDGVLDRSTQFGFRCTSVTSN